MVVICGGEHQRNAEVLPEAHLKLAFLLSSSFLFTKIRNGLIRENRDSDAYGPRSDQSKWSDNLEDIVLKSRVTDMTPPI